MAAGIEKRRIVGVIPVSREPGAIQKVMHHLMLEDIGRRRICGGGAPVARRYLGVNSDRLRVINLPIRPDLQNQTLNDHDERARFRWHAHASGDLKVQGIDCGESWRVSIGVPHAQSRFGALVEGVSEPTRIILGFPAASGQEQQEGKKPHIARRLHQQQKEGAPVIEPPLPRASGRPPCTLPYVGHATRNRLRNVVHLHTRRADGTRTQTYY